MLVHSFWIHGEPRGIESVLLLVVEVGRKSNSIIINSYVLIISVLAGGRDIVLSTAELADIFSKPCFYQGLQKHKYHEYKTTTTGQTVVGRR